MTDAVQVAASKGTKSVFPTIPPQPFLEGLKPHDDDDVQALAGCLWWTAFQGPKEWKQKKHSATLSKKT